jgi:hypothetical protein
MRVECPGSKSLQRQLHEEKKKISLNIECIGKLTLDGYHTKWYKHYKRAVSTDRDSEMESNEEGGVVVPARDETDNEERHPFVDKTSHGQYSSELEARAHAFWNVLERQLLVSAMPKLVNIPYYTSINQLLTAPSFGGSKIRSS